MLPEKLYGLWRRALNMISKWGWEGWGVAAEEGKGEGLARKGQAGEFGQLEGLEPGDGT